LEHILSHNDEQLKTVVEMGQELDRLILAKAMEWARRAYRVVAEALDEQLFKAKGDGLVSEGKREVWYDTCVGKVRVKRRLYSDGQGRYRHLLDELLCSRQKRHVTVRVLEMTTGLATQMVFRRSAAVLKDLTPVHLSAMTILNYLKKVAAPELEKATAEVRNFLEAGELPPGEGKKVPRLMVESDGVMVPLQREKQRKAEVKVGIAYEGWRPVGKDRYATVDKMCLAGVASGEEHWAAMLLRIHQRYDVSSVKEIVLGGDGAGWIKGGTEVLGARFALSRYHLHEELCRGLGRDRDGIRQVIQLCDRGELPIALQLLSQARMGARGEPARRLDHLAGYLVENGCGLKDYRLDLGEEGKNLRRTGAIEGNVDKLVARRMKNQGMSWTIAGIQRMLCVRLMVLQGTLQRVLNETPAPRIPHLRAKQVRAVIDSAAAKVPTAEWLQAAVPALHGPHPNRPWVMFLRSLVGVSG